MNKGLILDPSSHDSKKYLFISFMNRLVPIEVHYMEKILECFHQKPSFLFD